MELSRLKTAEARLNVFVRVVAIIFLVVGSVVAYYTATTNLTPQLPPVFYTLSALMILSGLYILVAKLE